MAYSARELNLYLKNIQKVDEDKLKRASLDRIIIGNPETRVKKVATMWMPYLKDIKKAYLQGANVLIVHEPTFYSYGELEEHEEEYSIFSKTLGIKYSENKYKKAIQEKKKWILDQDMVIIRCHDMIDRLKEIGMPFALGNLLGFDNSKIIDSTEMYNVYEIKEEKAGNIAEKIAKEVKNINQPGVAFYGDKDKLVRSIGIGTGCACDPLRYGELEADFHIAITDTIKTWVQSVFAEDTGEPLMVIDHGTAEECGMVNLNKYLKDRLTEIEFIHISQGCGYKWII